jgi:hypothetical protein
MRTIEALLEMETATKLIQLQQPSNASVLDSCFSKLNIDMSHISPLSPTFATLDAYLQRTMASTHKAKYTPPPPALCFCKNSLPHCVFVTV